MITGGLASKLNWSEGHSDSPPVGSLAWLEGVVQRARAPAEHTTASPEAAGALAAGVIASDPGTDPDPTNFWGGIECGLDPEHVVPGRHRLIERGGDPRPPPGTNAPTNRSYRLLRVLDGDDFYGERCELGRNDLYLEPNTVFYTEGAHLLTDISLRVPDDFPLETDNAFQGAIQMKQTQPTDVGNDAPPIAMGIYQGRWQLFVSDHPAGDEEAGRVIWSAPAKEKIWTRFVFDVVYSADPERGSLQVNVDTDGDGDFEGPEEISPVFGEVEPLATLRAEIPESGGEEDADGFAPGDPVPSHLRVGIYHDPLIDCPARGCAIGVDNVAIAPAGTP
jgi:hypothetical protein